MKRREFLRVGAVGLGSFWVGGAHAAHEDAHLAARLMATMDARRHEDVSARGVVGLDVLETLQTLPHARQKAAGIQAVMQRAGLWVGESLQRLRQQMIAILRGAPLEESALDAALEVITAESESLSRQRVARQLRARLSSDKRERFARQVLARLDRAEARAKRQREAGVAFDVRWLAEPTADDPVKKFFEAILLIILIAFAIIAAIVLIGGIVILVGIATGNPWLIAIGGLIVLTVAILIIGLADQLAAPTPLRECRL